MRSLMLTPEASDVLAFIRRTEFPLSVCGRSAARVWPMVREQVNRRISHFGVPVHEINIDRRYRRNGDTTYLSRPNARSSSLPSAQSVSRRPSRPAALTS